MKSESKTGTHEHIDSKSFQEDDRVIPSPTVSSGENKRERHTENPSNTGGKEVAIQANEYEIERGSSNLPHRRRFVPLRFSDYRVFASNVKEEEEEEEEVDSNFKPKDTFTKCSVIKPSKVKRGRGRPRKYPDSDSLQERLTVENEGTRDPIRKEIIKAPNGYKCNICERVFSLRGNAKAHLITHSDDKPFPCDYAGCHKKLRTKESLRRHKLSHMGIKMFECSECQKKFTCNLSLQEHMTLHTGEKPLTCDICGRKFRHLAVLKRHLTTHSNSKPFACGLCGRRFALKVYVHSHMKTHTGERPFNCDVCQKSFAHASDLNRHKIIHSGKKPYECSICSMRYSDPSSKRRHEREHQNKQQYICHICSQKFPRAGQLRVHIVKEHSTEQTSLPYRVEMGVKSATVHKAWAHCATAAINNKPCNTTDAQAMINSTVVTQQVTEPHSAGQGEKEEEHESFISTVQSQSLQLVVDNTDTSQVGCIMPERIVIQETDCETDKDGGGQTMIMELPQTSGEFIDLQPALGCHYRIINHDDKNQVYELHLEGAQLPFQEMTNALKINLSDLKIKDGTIALVQDGDSITVINQPDLESLKISDDVITIRSDDVVVSKQTLDRARAETPKDDALTSQHQESVVAVIENCVSDDVQQKISETDQHADILLEHSGQTLAFAHTHIDESLSVAGRKSTNTVQYANEDSSCVQLANISPILDSDFVSHPDLNSQEYYNWLAAFSETSKCLTLPLEKDIFLKINQVQKTLSDYMALPSGVISDKNNFKILMNITQDLSTIISSHLTIMYSNLSQ